MGSKCRATAGWVEREVSGREGGVLLIKEDLMSAIPVPEPWRSTPPVELLAAAWLAGYASPRTRRTYRAMIRSWFDWCARCQVDPLGARRAHVELWQRHLEQHGYALRTIALKLTAVASFYRYCEQEAVVDRTPMACVRRPRVERLSPPEGHSPEDSSTICSPPPTSSAPTPTGCAVS
jgi:integrase/recombinase XerD